MNCSGATSPTVRRGSYNLLARVLFALVLGHLAAALLHAWVRRDGVFSSMVQSACRR